MRHHRLVVMSIAAFAATVFAAQPFAQAPGQTATLRKKSRTVVLQPSTRFAAFRLTDGANEQLFGVAMQSNQVVSALFRSPILAARQLLLVGAPPDVQPFSDAFRQTVSRIAGRQLPQVPVYSIGNVDVIATSDVLVKFMGDATDGERRRIADLVGGQFIERPAAAPWLLRLAPNRSAIDASNALNEQASVRYAEPDFVIAIPPRPRVPRAGSPAAPAGAPPAAGALNDPLYPRQWSLRNPGVGNKNADIRVAVAWSNVTATAAITVAVLDEGVDVRHADLKAKIVHPHDAMGLLPAGKQDPNPWDGHGTAVAGIIAAGTNNAQGIAAVGYDTKLMPIRIASSEKPTAPGRPNPWVTTTRIMGAGIRYAVDRGADVLNNSWNGGNDGLSDAVEEAIDYALTKGRNGLGAVVVFSAGNTGSSVVWPATLAGSTAMITVAATNEWDEIKTGKTQDKEDWWASSVGPEVTIAAPGVHILTTDNVGDDGFAKGDDYAGAFNATSSAAPHVSGVAALLLAKYPKWKPQDVKDRIRTTADALKNADGSPSPFGRLNACKALGGSGC